ncbi:MAG: anti-sigma factor [Rhodanobacteraceae bacterium]
MNTPSDQEHPDLRYAEYVLGVLAADERVRVEREIDSDRHAADEVRWWQARLTPLSEDLAAVVPPEYVWARIREALGHSAVSPGSAASETAEGGGLWNSLRFWHWLGLGASAVAAACLVLLLLVPRGSPIPGTVQPPPTVVEVPAPANYLTAQIVLDSGVAGWNATMDAARGEMIVQPASPHAVAKDRSTELWLIPKGGKPIALGVFPADKAARMKLPAGIAAKLGPDALLAVSVEPLGGSPTGQPTGPVIGKGAIEAAPSA